MVLSTAGQLEQAGIACQLFETILGQRSYCAASQGGQDIGVHER